MKRHNFGKIEAHTANMDWKIQPNGYNASTFTYTYIPFDKFVFYLRVNLISENRTKEKLGWIQLRIDLSIVPIKWRR
jgi:hypothetical protein